MSLGPEVLLLALLVCIGAALIHGAFGLGFPMVATPLLALMFDVKTAILLTLAPNVLVNLWSLMHGGGCWQTIKQYWYIAAVMTLGSAIGTVLLIVLDPNPFRLLLAASIVFYLVSDRLSRLDLSILSKKRHQSGIMIGLGGGLLGGTVNVGAPPLMIYFLELGVKPLVLVQAINLCFLAGKSTQIITFAALGYLTTDLIFWSIPLAIVAMGGLSVGMRLRQHFDASQYRKMLRLLLWLLSALLVSQFAYAVIT
ncbi:hypothetical protein SAMN05216526_1137 [Ectothiorhodosinus mongolicus]|uniref:Probable membrane transporter protein n=1 Tax=Ectothiorhodosinus mongolicus TaxID=233100 RepID=A0A1R3VX06_9GAMM|nr:sulfite exporter TauE/SafE family protein [Ectothiorhodosinus mongolicus]ULX57057.1 sulfite exporter TauE/SafE family protein [Ectothiorhodosinus mongolicus]SIT69681.1 hypothetical protein SAMN05216526_1137 [Ectothiorhodosinus mongolicus]